jgi:hypothetical protein
MWPNQPRTARHVQINADQTASQATRAQLSPILAVFCRAAGMIVRVHATLKCLRRRGSIKVLGLDAQRTDTITCNPGGTNLVGLAFQFQPLNACNDCLRFSGGPYPSDLLKFRALINGA